MTEQTATLGQRLTLADALESRGFESISRFGATGWQGRHEGRGCKVMVSRQSRTKYAGEVRYRKHLGWRLRIELETVVHTRLFFVKESVTSSSIIRWIYRWRKQAVVEQVPPELDGFRVVAVDEAYAERLVSERDAMAQVGHLLRDEASAALKGSVHMLPGTVFYGSPILSRDQVTTDRVLAVIRRLDEITRAAESIPPPTVPSRLSRFEKFAKRRPVAAVLMFLGGCLAALALFALLIVAALVAVAYLLGGPA